MLDDHGIQMQHDTDELLLSILELLFAESTADQKAHLQGLFEGSLVGKEYLNECKSLLFLIVAN